MNKSMITSTVKYRVIQLSRTEKVKFVTNGLGKLEPFNPKDPIHADKTLIVREMTTKPRVVFKGSGAAFRLAMQDKWFTNSFLIQVRSNTSPYEYQPRCPDLETTNISAFGDLPQYLKRGTPWFVPMKSASDVLLAEVTSRINRLENLEASRPNGKVKPRVRR
jgi:hypothetical protein